MAPALLAPLRKEAHEMAQPRDNDPMQRDSPARDSELDRDDSIGRGDEQTSGLADDEEDEAFEDEDDDEDDDADLEDETDDTA
jgi:hypothetical protein